MELTSERDLCALLPPLNMTYFLEVEFVAGLTNWLKRQTKDARKTQAKATKPANKKSPKKASATSEERFGWVEAKPFVLVAVGVLGLGSTAYGWWASEPHLINYVNRHHAPTALEIKFTHTMVNVDGIQSQLEQLIRTTLADAGPTGDHAYASLQHVHTSLTQSGWFDPEHLRVQRDLQSSSIDEQGNETGLRDVVTVAGPMRQPFALARIGDTDILIDQFGHRLPVEYEKDSVAVIPVIVGSGSVDTAVGDSVRGIGLEAGLQLLAFLREQDPKWLAQIRKIDVTNVDGRHRYKEPHLLLITDKNRPIAWGRAVGSESGIDNPPIEKVRLLDQYAKQRSGKIGDPMGLLRIDQPLSTVDRRGG